MTAPAADTPAHTTPAKPAKFVALAWIAFAFGIAGLAGSPIIILNNVTAILAGVGVILGIIALFGTNKILAAISTAMCIAAIVITVQVQSSVVSELDKIGDQFEQDMNTSNQQFQREMDKLDKQMEQQQGNAPAPGFGG